MRTVQIPITLQSEIYPISEMPISTLVDFATLIPPGLREDGVLDLFSLRLLDSEQRHIPLQFSPDALGSESGTLRWLADSAQSEFLLCADIISGQPVMDGAVFGKKVFEPNGDARPLPDFARMQAIPMPGSRVSIQRDGVEVLGYNYGDSGEHSRRPYLFPLLGPSGWCVTRIGHPHDPVGHRHHYSIWLAYHHINGVDFWSDGESSGRQVHQKFLTLSDGPVFSGFTAIVHWQNPDGETLMEETKRVSVFPLSGNELLVDFRLRFAAVDEAVRLEKTQFGFLGVRVAKTMGVFDGSGRIQNSEGGINEREIFWQRARWCDYSGPITEGEWNGIAIFDHPGNPNHPSHWHVRSDGWMSPCPFLEKGQILTPDESLELNYRLFVHADDANAASVRARYEEYIGTVGVEMGTDTGYKM
jgi:hypothetical protein